MTGASGASALKLMSITRADTGLIPASVRVARANREDEMDGICILKGELCVRGKVLQGWTVEFQAMTRCDR